VRYEDLPATLHGHTSEVLNYVCDTNFPECGGLIDEAKLEADLQALVLKAFEAGRQAQIAVERAKATDRWCDEQ
jgi:hypothetical protein